jgi:hypothetical protein
MNLNKRYDGLLKELNDLKEEEGGGREVVVAKENN